MVNNTQPVSDLYAVFDSGFRDRSNLERGQLQFNLNPQKNTTENGDVGFNRQIERLIEIEIFEFSFPKNTVVNGVFNDNVYALDSITLGIKEFSVQSINFVNGNTGHFTFNITDQGSKLLLKPIINKYIFSQSLQEVNRLTFEFRTPVFPAEFLPDIIEDGVIFYDTQSTIATDAVHNLRNGDVVSINTQNVRDNLTQIDWISNTLVDTVPSAFNSVIAPTDFQVVSLYQDTGTTFGMATYGIIENGTIIWNPPVTFSTVATTSIRAVTIDHTRYAVAYASGGTGNIRIGQIQGNQVAFIGLEYTFNAATTDNINILLLGLLQGTTTYCLVVVYRDIVSGDGRARVLLVDGTVVTPQTEFTFSTGTSQLAATTLTRISEGSDKDRFIVVYQRGINFVSSVGIIDTSETATQADITFQSRIVIREIIAVDSVVAAEIKNNQVIIGYRNTTSLEGDVQIGILIRDHIEWGTEVSFDNSNGNIGILVTNENQLTVVHEQNGTSQLFYRLGAIRDNTVTFGTLTQLDPNTPSAPSLISNGNIYFLVTYTDVTNAGFPTTKLGFLNKIQVISEFDPGYEVQILSTTTFNLLGLTTTFTSSYPGGPLSIGVPISDNISVITRRMRIPMKFRSQSPNVTNGIIPI